jgi:hypothetical protein
VGLFGFTLLFLLPVALYYRRAIIIAISVFYIVCLCCMIGHDHTLIICTRVLTLHALVALLVSLGLLSDNPGLVCSRYLCLYHGADAVPAGGHRFLDSP